MVREATCLTGCPMVLRCIGRGRRRFGKSLGSPYGAVAAYGECRFCGKRFLFIYGRDKSKYEHLEDHLPTPERHCSNIQLLYGLKCLACGSEINGLD